MLSEIRTSYDNVDGGKKILKFWFKFEMEQNRPSAAASAASATSWVVH